MAGAHKQLREPAHVFVLDAALATRREGDAAARRPVGAVGGRESTAPSGTLSKCPKESESKGLPPRTLHTIRSLSSGSKK